MMNRRLQPHIDRPGTYRIRVGGRLSQSWADRMWGNLTVTSLENITDAETELTGEVIDQAALIGIINGLYNSGYAVLVVERIDPIRVTGSDAGLMPAEPPELPPMNPVDPS